MDFKDKVVWITGASSGIGEALAYALASKGARLALSARRLDELARVRAACTDPARHLVVPLDLARPQDFAERVAEVEGYFGRIDLLINNAGISQRSLAMDTSIDVDRRLMDINYLGTVALTKAVLPGMCARKAGRIATVTSVAGKLGTPMRSGYAAAKHALHGFFDSLRAEIWADGIGVTLICPGFIRTNLPLVALTGNGAPQGHMDAAQQNGMPPEVCARRILAGLAADKQEIVVAGSRERLAVWLKRLAPGVLAHVLQTAKVT